VKHVLPAGVTVVDCTIKKSLRESFTGYRSTPGDKMGWRDDIGWTSVDCSVNRDSSWRRQRSCGPSQVQKRESSQSSDTFTTAALNALIVCPFRNCLRVIAMEVAHGPFRVFSDLRTLSFLFPVSKQIERGWQPCMQTVLKWMLLRLDCRLHTS
jgi:hypothetical protein